MAKIVLGMVASHGPLLGTPPELWAGRVQADHQNPALAFRGKEYTFPQLLEARRGENFEPDLAIEVKKRRYEACQSAIKEMARVFGEVKPDVAVVIGNDQMEIMAEDNQPAMMIYHGETFENVPFNDEQLKRLGPGVAIAEPNHHPPKREVYPGAPDLALHMIESLMNEEFDVATSQRLPEQRESKLTGIPHAWGFFYRRIMEDRVVPNVPVFINTFYPPNRPSVKRCLGLGAAIARAIESWDKDLRVAVMGSGGMSHFVVDEEFDRKFMKAFVAPTYDEMLSFPDDMFRSGTAELKCWVPVKSAMDRTDLKMTVVDYQPLIRSPAGTGSGMGFAYWR
jgi:Catalytic LigB subunit of aromatic ring-opening dioxygenase